MYQTPLHPPGWDQAPWSPTLDLSSFQGVVEKGVLVNVARSPGDMLEELGCLLLDDINDDEVYDVTEGHTSVQAHDDNSQAEQQEEKSSNEEELMRHKEHVGGDVSSPEMHSHEDQVLDDNEDPDVSDAELAE